jgi:hypothetical protein
MPPPMLKPRAFGAETETGCTGPAPPGCEPVPPPLASAQPNWPPAAAAAADAVAAATAAAAARSARSRRPRARE